MNAVQAGPMRVYDLVTLSEWIGGVPAETVGRLLDSDRFGRRLRHLIEDRLEPLPGAPSISQAAVLAMDEPALDGLALRAGAVWHGRAMARAVDGQSVRAQVAAIGAELRALGLAQGWLRGPPSTDAMPEDLALAVRRDGLACLHAWCREQPPAVGQRVALCLPPPLPLPSQDAGHHAAGPRIVAALAGAAGA